MRLDVFLTPGELSPSDVAERTAVVIDVLRATSTIVEALVAGAKSIYPVASTEEAIRLANTIGREEVLLCGERKCVPIQGFDLGNSPREFSRERVAGKTLVMTTTNGTRAIAQTAGAARVLIASALNLSAVVDELARSVAEPVLVCSGREQHISLDDAVFAGEIALRLQTERPGEWELNDGAQIAMALAREFRLSEKLFATTAAGRALIEVGMGDDLAFCAQIDLHDALPLLNDRQITLAAPVAATSESR